MADLGFLPAVRRLLDATPRNGQRMLFSATLDTAVDVLVKRFLRQPGHARGRLGAVAGLARWTTTCCTCSTTSACPVLVDLTSRARPHGGLHPHQARRQERWPASSTPRGVPAVELHGNLAQNARTRNMEAFHSGRATTLVATDIAARGIHVDDVALVVHADPPAEHKAYLHRSGRTARAGAAGTVVTLMTDQQVQATSAT